MTPSLYYKIGVSYFLFVGMDYGPWTVFNSSTNFINFLVIYIYIYSSSSTWCDFLSTKSEDVLVPIWHYCRK
jgi:hypothetical protein